MTLQNSTLDSADQQLPRLSDEQMQRLLQNTRDYTVAVLKKGPRYSPPHTNSIIFEHGRRNAALRAAGLLSIVCPIRDGTEVAGIGIFGADVAVVNEIALGDPAIQAGVLTHEIHAARSFPGDELPGGVISYQHPRVTQMPPELPEISNEMMYELLATARSYTVRILKRGPNYGTPGADAIIWEHGRRNLRLRAVGTLAISCPIRDGGEIAGVGIFDREPEEVVAIMHGDPAIQAGVLMFEAHPGQSFPGDRLA
jgi:hypothetical protein